MIDFRDYLKVAATLVAGATEAEWRSGTSRAYYAAFHVAREALVALGFRPPKADRAHAYTWLRLANSGETAVEKAGNALNDLRGQRNAADYDAGRPFLQAISDRHLRSAEEIVRTIDAVLQEPMRTQITDAMKVYERDVLKDVTWQS